MSKTFLATVLALVTGCASQSNVPTERTGSTDESIIGGVAASSPSMNAIGSLVTISRNTYPWLDAGEQVTYGSPFCSATLIAPKAVLTAKHCVAGLSQASEFGFSIGPNARTPTRVVPVVAFETEPTIAGGFIKMGSDFAVLHLESAVKDIEPLAWSPVDAADIGKRFVAVGYGTQDVNGTAGTRRAGSLTLRGTEGKFYELAFGSFDAFKAKASSISDVSYQVGDVNTPDGEARARKIYDSQQLIPGGYEAFFGNGAGDAQTCHGDSGGPIIRRIDGKNTVFGVTSWGQHSTFGYAFCDYGGVFATLGPATATFLTKALAWQDACEDVTVKGRCEGDTTVRCSAKNEGTRRALRTDCAELGLTCGVGASGQVACVDR